jgi:hypothetical protein
MEPIEEPGYLNEKLGISRELPFEAPKGYFDTLASRIESRIKLEKKGLHANPFHVPEDYFDTMQNRITEKVSAMQRKPKLRIPAWYLTMAAAAMVIITFGVNFLVHDFNPSAPTAGDINPENISKEEISRKLEQMDVDESILIKAIDPKTLASSGNESVPVLQLDEKEINNIIDETDINDITNNM